MRRVALVTLLAFGCATVREPMPESPPYAEPVRRIALAEPQLELWMEGTGPIDPAERDRALAQSRDALSQALAGRGLDASDPEDLLFVHARAVARTDERKSAQTWSIVGIVFVFVAIVVTTVVASKHGSSRRAPGPAVAPVRPVRPGPYAPAYLPRRYPPPPMFGVNVGLAVAVPLAAGPAPSPVPWAPPDEAWLASRGWFDRDEVELTVELADAQTGAVRWHRTLRESIDPRDGEAVARLVDHALADAGFGERLPSPAPAPETPEKR